MPPLAEIQSRLRESVVAGDDAVVLPLLVGGQEPEKRLRIHRRHYEASLVTALLGKFPGTVWLVGSPFTIEAAREFVRRYPPRTPCIAEYGATFPLFLPSRPEADRIPYLGEFSTLEWEVGQASVATADAPLTAEELSRFAAHDLPEAGLALQPGIRYVQASWPIDELMTMFVTESAPDRLALEPADTWIEVRGSRGRVRLNRLSAATFTFRRHVQRRGSLMRAAELALELDPAFDPGLALVSLVAEGAVIGISSPASEHRTWHQTTQA